MRAIYLETARSAVIKKPSQKGASEFLISYAIHGCDERSATVLYVFPTDTHVSDFSSARLGPAIEASPYLSRIVTEGEPGSVRVGKRRGADRVTLKRIRNRFLYFRGARVTPYGNAPQLKSIDGDLIIADELDEWDQRALPIVRKRLGHSRIAEERLVSTPTYSGVGIDLEWQESSQQEWFLKCPHCGQWQFLTIYQVVREWDTLRRPVAWNGKKENRAWAGCTRCGQEMDHLAPGQWVARHPSREKVGYNLPAFGSPLTNILRIVQNLQTTDETKRRETWNQELGEVYVPRGGRITDDILDDCRRDYAHQPLPSDAPYAGADVGNVIHVVIRGEQNRETGEWPQRWAGECESFEELGRVMRRFNVKRLVIDAHPEGHKCREFQATFPPGKVWLAIYPGGSQDRRAEAMEWDEKNHTVIIDRTRSLDEMFSRFYDRKNTLPADAREVRDYYNHIKAPVRVLETRKDGQKVARYVEGSLADHYAHAENYCMAAMSAPEGGTYVPPDTQSVEEVLGF